MELLVKTAKKFTGKTLIGLPNASMLAHVNKYNLFLSRVSSVQFLLRCLTLRRYLNSQTHFSCSWNNTSQCYHNSCEAEKILNRKQLKKHLKERNTRYKRRNLHPFHWSEQKGGRGKLNNASSTTHVSETSTSSYIQKLRLRLFYTLPLFS